MLANESCKLKMNWGNGWKQAHKVHVRRGIVQTLPKPLCVAQHMATANLQMKKEKSQTAQFAVCVDNTDYPASLELGKLYRVIPDAEAERHGYLRVIDESGEAYWHAATMF